VTRGRFGPPEECLYGTHDKHAWNEFFAWGILSGRSGNLSGMKEFSVYDKRGREIQQKWIFQTTHDPLMNLYAHCEVRAWQVGTAYTIKISKSAELAYRREIQLAINQLIKAPQI
jgi:hypothetical protein